jgi:hypothetical protein
MLLPKSYTYKNEFLAQSIMLEQAVKFFIVFFVVVEPISLIPVFSGLTEGANDGYKHKMALKSVLVASLILLIFALVGAGFLSAMGISINSFRIFGGLLLALVLLHYTTRISKTVLFWSAFVLTRPLGAVVGDFLDKPVAKGGLALSRYSASAVLLVGIALLIFLLPQRAAARAH